SEDTDDRKTPTQHDRSLWGGHAITAFHSRTACSASTADIARADGSPERPCTPMPSQPRPCLATPMRNMREYRPRTVDSPRRSRWSIRPVTVTRHPPPPAPDPARTFGTITSPSSGPSPWATSHSTSRICRSAAGPPGVARSRPPDEEHARVSAAHRGQPAQVALVDPARDRDQASTAARARPGQDLRHDHVAVLRSVTLGDIAQHVEDLPQRGGPTGRRQVQATRC